MEDIKHSRPGETIAAIVEQGIAMQDAEGRPAAVAFLIARRVPDRVIARVLCEPELRRSN